MKSRPQLQETGARAHIRGIRYFIFAGALALPLLLLHASAFGQTPTRAATSTSTDEKASHSRVSGSLRQFNDSLVGLTKEVTPAVVQIMVTSYGPVESSSRTGNVALFARQHDLGSGLILDSEGYIITNAHVVQGAQRIRIALAAPDASAPFDATPASGRRILEARLVGADSDTDLALLKVDAHNLPVLALAPSFPVHPGEVVLAVGSPKGLQGSVTMGIVSSVWRQPDPDQPAVYIQTDAPINPGNSGGPLLDIDGNVIGLNTMILSEGGGSEGLGFAIPARVVQFVYESLRKYGRVHRTEIEAGAQEITPALAEGLRLSQDWGVVIGDVTPEGPADSAGLKPGDVVFSVDGRRIAGLPDFAAALYLHSADQSVLLDVLRGPKKVSLVVPAIQHHDKFEDLQHLIVPQNLVSDLGVFVHDFDGALRDVLPHLRIASGVIVVGQSPELNSYTSSLRAGDVLHALNQTPIESVDQLKSMLRGMKSRQSTVLQIERAGQLQYVSFEWGD
jgi:serine protease Do